MILLHNHETVFLRVYGNIPCPLNRHLKLIIVSNFILYINCEKLYEVSKVLA